MKARIAATGFIAALLLALPASAMGEEEAASVVPPENSAATQYTEALPTAGGDKEAHGDGRKPSPAKVLGAENAKRLESHGKEGREVAQIVAETAPAPAQSAGTSPSQGSSPESAEDNQAKEDEGRGGAAGGKSDGGSGPPSRPEAPAHPQGPTAQPADPPAALPDGSSGLGEVLAEATGSSSSGQLGALLPLAIIATIVWSLGYFWRQRRPVE